VRGAGVGPATENVGSGAPRRVPPAMLLAAVTIALALAACGAGALPRQAPRERSSDAPVATRAPLGGLFTVMRGDVVEDHLLAGIVGL